MALLHPGDPQECRLYDNEQLNEDAVHIYDVNGKRFQFYFSNPVWADASPEHWSRGGFVFGVGMDPGLEVSVQFADRSGRGRASSSQFRGRSHPHHTTHHIPTMPTIPPSYIIAAVLLQGRLHGGA